MLRLRRYRVFVACAVILLFLLYRVSVNSAWDEDIQSRYRNVASAVLPKPAPLSDDLSESNQVVLPKLKPIPHAAEEVLAEDDAPAPTRPPVVPPAQIPDRMPGVVHDVYPPPGRQPHHIQKPPGRYQPKTTFAGPPVHWTKMPEHFPVPTASIIPLPTGKPKSIPAIQHKFHAVTAETKEALELRKSRLAEVKSEMKRAWDAYTKYAFGHDELVPVSLDFGDPFGGWGATLVDSMDTLWIMGLKQEFDAAYDGVKRIDFTTCVRSDIPVFETVIRYLGGLIAAYDMTGGRKGEYPLLLTKAIELAEILIGAFDTPNRMPVLYYNWMPAYVSQPHRASTRSGIAELGTLSMEFTRLAQLTGDDKYYDAVARITNALHEWQNRDDGTAPLIDGIFPEAIDASGCNQSATALLLQDGPSSRAKAQAPIAGEPQGYVGKAPGSAQAGLGAVDDVLETDTLTTAAKRSIQPRTVPQGPESAPGSSVSFSRASSPGRLPTEQPLGADGLPVEWECVAQNLTATQGTQSFSMGGSQDSVYEYFPKQYLLLGGLDDKYQSLHENTVEAVKKHLLFRPVVPDGADILFSARAKVFTGDQLPLSERMNREYEVTHLTCFLGGMFAMGAKIFDSEEDLDIGRRLTDGCVWAYSSMPSGIMAEYAQLVPCQDTDSCDWNETEWHLGIDPDPEARERQIGAYYGRLAEWEATKQKILRAEAERMQAEEELGYKFEEPARQTTRKRALDAETGDTLAFDPSTLDQNAIEEKIKMLEQELENPIDPPLSEGSYGGMASQVSIEQTTAQKPNITSSMRATIAVKPHKPKNHQEQVADKIRDEALPPGYTKIGGSGYQLRPEAIESVWYMYRITGDPTWQDKGWTMWKAIMANVKTQHAHSAVRAVNSPHGTNFADKMESFWTAETLKYFYLLYSDPDVVSLDDWVLNTEAHPFKRSF